MFSKNVLRSKRLLWMLCILSIIAYLASLGIVNFATYVYQLWLAFHIYILGLLLLVFAYCVQNFYKIPLKKILTGNELNPVLILLIITIIANFSLLSTYPYVSIADELRDGGLIGMRIASGITQNFFDYGSYDSQGLIVPMTSIPFYYIFSNSTLTYRFPAALFSTLDVMLLYLLIRLILNKRAAFWSALVLASLPLHMFFAHTQMVVALNFLWVPVVLLVLLHLIKNRSFVDYIFFGTLTGFVFQFHAAIRVFMCLVLIAFLFMEFRQTVIEKFQLTKELKQRLQKLFLLVLFIFVGFGPLLLVTQPQLFFHSSRFIFENKIQSHSQLTNSDFSTVENNYIKSLMIYTYEPTTFFYPDERPLLSPFLAIFFFLGIGYAFFILKNYLINILLFLLIILPFFTSALTDLINASHRASPLFALSAVFVGIGIDYFLNIIKNKNVRYIFIALFLFYVGAQIKTFYTDQPANKNVPLRDYVAMHAYYFLQADKTYKASPAVYLQDMRRKNSLDPVCLIVSPQNYHYYTSNAGIKEQPQFLLPGVSLHYMQSNTLKDNEVDVWKHSCSAGTPLPQFESTNLITCSLNSFACPIGYAGNIVIHY